jgi:hypothetical protein
MELFYPLWPCCSQPHRYFFTDWFHKKTIQIIPTVRPTQASAIPRDPDQPPVYPYPSRWTTSTN